MTVFEKIKSFESAKEMMLFFYTHKEVHYGMKRMLEWPESEAEDA